MDRFISLLGAGLAEGAIITLSALGFVLVFRATAVVNFAGGDFITLGAYLALWGITTLELPIWIAYAMTIVLMFLIGVALERTAYAPLKGRSIHVMLLSTFGASIVIRAGLSLWWGADPRGLDSPIPDDVVRIAGGVITYQRVAIIVVTLLLVTVLTTVMARTSVGRQLRALADDAEVARLNGVRTSRFTMLVFGVSGALAAVAALLIAPVGAFDLNLGFSVMLNGFAAAIIAGNRSYWGLVLVSFGLGVIEQTFGGYVFRDFKDAYPFLLLILIVVLRPQGLFGGSSVRARL